jgi:hypothetical protein
MEEKQPIHQDDEVQQVMVELCIVAPGGGAAAARPQQSLMGHTAAEVGRAATSNSAMDASSIDA